MYGAMLEETAFYRWLLEALKEELPPVYEWLVQQATEKAIAQAELDGMRMATLLVLRGRFGEPTADVAAAVDSASRETLNAILLNAATDTLAQVRERLGLALDGQPQA